MAIELTKDEQDEAVSALQLYSKENMDERMGNIAAGALLDFFLTEVAPSVYNKAVADAQLRMQARVMELDVDLHEEEFPASRRR